MLKVLLTECKAHSLRRLPLPLRSDARKTDACDESALQISRASSEFSFSDTLVEMVQLQSNESIPSASSSEVRLDKTSASFTIACSCPPSIARRYYSMARTGSVVTLFFSRSNASFLIASSSPSFSTAPISRSTARAWSASTPSAPSSKRAAIWDMAFAWPAIVECGGFRRIGLHTFGTGLQKHT